MRRVLLLLSAVALFFLPRPATADDDQAKGPERPGRDMLMKRLDANQDGAITKDEVPEQAPEFLKAMLKQADKDGDGKVTKEELAALRPMGPPRGPGGPPAAAPSRGPGRGGPPAEALPRGLPKPPSAEAIFKRLDKDGDGKLTLEEFTVGVKAAQAIVGRLASHARAAAFRRPGPPTAGVPPFAKAKEAPPRLLGRGPQAGPPREHKPGPPQFHGRGGPHHGPPMAGPPGRAPFGAPQVGPHGRVPFGPPKAGPPGRPGFGPPKAGPPRGHKPGPPDAEKPGPKKPHHKRGDKDDDDEGEDDD